MGLHSPSVSKGSISINIIGFSASEGSPGVSGGSRGLVRALVEGSG